MDQELERRTLSKISWRLIPFMCLCYLVAFIDRTNLGAAWLRMTWFEPSVYGTAAGIFFLGYFFFEVPSNIMLEKVGARLWIARIMILWGLICSAMMFVGHSKLAFYGLRFALGVGEAGFFPGMILYLTYWFPTSYRTRTVSLFMAAAAFSSVVGNFVSGLILSHMNGVRGLADWQWLFILEGLPAVVLGFGVLLYLPNGPRDARWLGPEELAWLTERLARERAEREKHDHLTLWQALSNPRVFLLAILYFCVVIGGYGLEFFLPKILELRTHWTDLGAVTRLSTVPSLVAVGVMILWGRHSDHTGERRWHVAVAMGMAAVGLALVAYTQSPVLTVVGMCMAVSGRWSATSTFWGLPTAFLSGTAAAGGIAMINSIGNLGGYVGPSVMGWLKGYTQSFSKGLMVLSACFLAGSMIAVLIRLRRAPPELPSTPEESGSEGAVSGAPR
jgi:ACS family tartrate transporter-like MFS transporter